MNNEQKNLVRGILLAILASAMLACMSASVKELKGAIPISSIVFFRFSFSFICIIPWILLSKEFRFKGGLPMHFLIRIFAALFALIFTFKALTTTPLTSVLLLNNTAPLFIPLIALVFMRTKTHISVWLAIAIGFTGIVIVLKPSGLLSSNPGQWLALAAGFLAAIALLELRVLRKKNTALQMLFYYYGACVVICGITSLFNWNWPTTRENWILLGLVGLFGTIYQISITLAITKASARIITPLTFTSVIWGAVIERVLWGTSPAINQIFGFIVVVIGGALVIYFGQKHIVSHKPDEPIPAKT